MTEKPNDNEKELTKAAKQMQLAMAPMIAQMQSISNSIQPTLRAIEAMRINILPSLKIMKSWQKNFIPIFNRIDFQRLAQKAQEMNTPAFKSFIKEWGWLVNNKSISFGDYCYGLYKRYGNRGFKNKINRWFYHKDNLDLVLADIKSRFPERYSIIAEGVEYYKKNNYACSITLLLPHVEGILWDIGMEKKLVRKGYNSMKKYSIHVTSKKRNEWKLSGLSSKLFPKDKFHQILIKEIFCEGPRNKILHGRNIYNKKQREMSRWRSTLLILTLWRLTDEL